MKNTFLLISCLLWGSLHAQQLSEIARPVPAALCSEAPMPQDLAKKYARAEQARQNKFVTPQRETNSTIDSDLLLKRRTYLTAGKEAFTLAFTPGEQYTFCSPEYRIINSSHGREPIKSKEGKFNPKKDRLSYAVLKDGNEISIINQDHKAVDMSDFQFTTNSEVIRMEGNKIFMEMPILELAKGIHPMVHKVKCTHTPSGGTFTFDILLSWPKKINMSGELHAFALSPLTDTKEELGLLCDLDTKTLRVVSLPLLIDGDGINGVDGRRGHSGISGTDRKTYKDSDGNTHVINGTCGTAGNDGTDATDGTDGGRFLFCISPEMVATYGLDGLVAFVDAGTGGVGGKGGAGGRHGNGSGCSGKAPDGRNGRDGKNGRQGDFLYVLTDVNPFYQQIIPSAL